MPDLMSNWIADPVFRIRKGPLPGPGDNVMQHTVIIQRRLAHYPPLTPWYKFKPQSTYFVLHKTGISAALDAGT